MADIFGYNKSQQTGGLANPSNVGVFIGNSGQIALAQAVNLKYGRQVQPVFTLGSDSVWMQPGPASGTLDMTRIVGVDGALAGLQNVGPCETTTITISGTGSFDCGAKFGTVSCSGCMLTQVGVSASIQGLIVTDSATWQVGSVQI